MPAFRRLHDRGKDSLTVRAAEDVERRRREPARTHPSRDEDHDMQNATAKDASRGPDTLRPAARAMLAAAAAIAVAAAFVATAAVAHDVAAQATLFSPRR